MVDGNIIEVGFLNIVASPHPDGVYVEALTSIANAPVKVRGRDYAIITKPTRSERQDGMYEGVISVWTDIDSSEPSIDKNTFRQLNVEDALKKIFRERGFNNRSFSYMFDEKTHKIAVELKNSLGKTLSIKNAARIFEELLSQLNRDGQTFDVTIMPEEDAIDRVLGMERLDKIVIVLKRPNPGDHHGSDADDVLRELHEQNMKRAEYQFSRQPGTDGIHLNEENRTRAEVAATNGHVESFGVDDDERAHMSTKEYPKIVRRVLAAGTLFGTAIATELRRFRG